MQKEELVLIMDMMPFDQGIDNEKIRVLGVCLGASTISVVEMEKDKSSDNSKPRIINYFLYPHEGNPRQTLISIFNKLNPNLFDRIAATGRNFRKYVNLSSIPEPEAVEYAYRFVKPPNISCPAIVSAGGETTMVYVLNKNGLISNVITGNKCASGTGEFFLQQLRRMNVSLDEAAKWAATESPYHVSGRCSVFCKSDCTHATNKGVPKPKVTAGLCRMMANKILELLKKIEKEHVMLTGGTSRNKIMVEYLRQEIPTLIVPEEAPCFEALGVALWAFDNTTQPFPGISMLFRSESSPYDVLKPLKDFEHMVEFKTIEKGKATSGDEYILGLDVGSTTTKAVLVRKDDHAIVASVYLRTNGDPVGASRLCYQAILDQIRQQVDPSDIRIIGLGVCGSGRQIAGLHAQTEGVINEIIAHATAAVHFDPDVDTIFEIGGQDAKYTYITNSVSSDYAMNEACSAGTGSFLEESAYETLGVKMEDIADIALKGKNPPNFNDQCAAFIASDIKNAIHEGIHHEDIIAGLVYSICMNYSNRVKGNRPVGEKVFMQGGVCYNRAVPLAMASLVGKPIIVPPEPGLMGAYGVALEVKKRIDAGIMTKSQFDLETLIKREVIYGKTFQCKGGKEKCDRHCEISVIELDGKKFPFGGACNRYYNLRHGIHYDVKLLDFVRKRQELVFQRYGAPLEKSSINRQGKTVGFNRSFLINSYYPLYSTFFSSLGLKITMPDIPSADGIDKRNAPFCYPVELAHGFFYSLITMSQLDYIFLPHFMAVPSQNGNLRSQVCPLVQGEPFYLQAAFKDQLDQLRSKKTKVLSPLIDLTLGIGHAKKSLIGTALQMGFSQQVAEDAFEKAQKNQIACFSDMKEMGKNFLADLEKNPDQIAVVIFARPYNGFVDEAHKGIPHKLATRGIPVVPFDFLPFEKEEIENTMYWGMGQMLLKAARFVKKHPQLFGLYITNFSCGPDSFVLGFFRDIMGQKPSLTLELDSHTADAGLETRIEAFLDIVKAYRQLISQDKIVSIQRPFQPAKTFLDNGTIKFVTSSGETISLTDPRITFMLPSMGELSSEAIAAIFRGVGIRAISHPPADENILKLGRANTTCKECLPLILTTGMLLNQIQHEIKNGNMLVYFMATASGPCRFGQYYKFMENLINKHQIPNVALFSLSAENSYAGLGDGFYTHVWWSVIISDVMEDIRSMLLTNARDPEEALSIFNEEWKKLIHTLEKRDYKIIEDQLIKTAFQLKQIKLKRPTEEVPIISLVGEIFVRRDGLSRQYLTERLAKRGFATVCSPVSEWLHYTDYCLSQGLAGYQMSMKEWAGFLIKQFFKNRYEKRIKNILSSTGLVHAEVIKVKKIIQNAQPYISKNLTGEAILTIGSSLHEVADVSCGIIAIGPFGCMPNRLSESILNVTMNREGKLATNPTDTKLQSILSDMEDLPFLAIETDGSPFSQLIEAKLETFCLRAERLHQQMLKNKRR